MQDMNECNKRNYELLRSKNWKNNKILIICSDICEGVSQQTHW